MTHPHPSPWPTCIVNTVLVALPILTTAFIIIERPEYYVKNGGYLFAILSLVGALFLVFSKNERKWQALYVVFSCLVFLAVIIVLGLVLHFLTNKLLAVGMFYTIAVSGLALIVTEITDVYKYATVKFFKTKREFYELFWLIRGHSVGCHVNNAKLNPVRTA